MTRTEQLALIRQKCVEANPEIKTRGHMRYAAFNTRRVGDEVRLADVLLAIGVRYGYGVIAVDETGRFWKLNSGEGSIQDAGYDLRKDDLTKQSDECMAFLAELLK